MLSGLRALLQRAGSGRYHAELRHAFSCYATDRFGEAQGTCQAVPTVLPVLPAPRIFSVCSRAAEAIRSQA